MASERPQTHFPFGKHKGTPIDDVPADYLVWALSNMDGLRADTRAMIQASLKRRGSSKVSEPVPSKPATQIPCPACGSILAVSLREAALQEADAEEEVPF